MIDLDAIFAEPLEPAPEASAHHAVVAHLDDEADRRPAAIARGLAWIASQRWAEQTVGGVRITTLAGAAIEPLHNFPADGWPPGDLRPLLTSGNEQFRSHTIAADAMQGGTSTADTCTRGSR